MFPLQEIWACFSLEDAITDIDKVHKTLHHQQSRLPFAPVDGTAKATPVQPGKPEVPPQEVPEGFQIFEDKPGELADSDSQLVAQDPKQRMTMLQAQLSSTWDKNWQRLAQYGQEKGVEKFDPLIHAPVSSIEDALYDLVLEHYGAEVTTVPHFCTGYDAASVIDATLVKSRELGDLPRNQAGYIDIDIPDFLN